MELEIETIMAQVKKLQGNLISMGNKNLSEQSKLILEDYAQALNIILALLEKKRNVWIFGNKPPLDFGLMQVTLKDDTVGLDTFSGGKWEKYSVDEIKAYKFFELSEPATDEVKEKEKAQCGSDIPCVWYNEIGDSIEFSVSRESTYAQWINNIITVYRSDHYEIEKNKANPSHKEKGKIVGFQLTNVRSIVNSLNLMGL